MDNANLNMDVKLEKFSGPLDLLLQLIEEKRLEITDIALAEVTDQYLSYIEGAETDMAQLADFLMVASKLLLIKSRALLPALALSGEEEGEIRDFALQLREYQRYREAMKTVKQFALEDKFIYTRPAWSGLNLGFFPPDRLSAKELGTALKQILDALEQFLRPLEEKLIGRTVTIEEKIKEIMARIEKRARLGLAELAGGTKADLILAFLALLFLFKEKVLKVTQTKRFGEIAVVRRG